MHREYAVSNDKCVAGLHRLIALVANLFYSLKGDICSFLAQCKKLDSSTIEARYALHIKDNMSAARDKLIDHSKEARRLITSSNSPDAVKIKWMKYIALCEDTFKNVASHQIHSDPQDYETTAENLLEIVNSFQNLTGSFSHSVELVTLDRDSSDGFRHLQDVEKTFRNAFKVAQKHGFIMELTGEERKQLRNQLAHTQVPRSS